MPSRSVLLYVSAFPPSCVSRDIQTARPTATVLLYNRYCVRTTDRATKIFVNAIRSLDNAVAVDRGDFSRSPAAGSPSIIRRAPRLRRSVPARSPGPSRPSPAPRVIYLSACIYNKYYKTAVVVVVVSTGFFSTFFSFATRSCRPRSTIIQWQ